jgi:hypothetical protein
MQIIALSRWGAPLETELPALAKLLGVVPYDLRLRIAGATPVVLTTTPDLARAKELTSLLRMRGHGIVVCDGDAVPGPNQQVAVREFVFGASTFECKDGPGRAIDIPYVDIQALVRVAQISTAEQTTTTTEKKFNAGMAVVSGGLIMSKKVEKVAHTASETREQVLYLFRRGYTERPTPIVFRESYVRYQGLGTALKPSTILNIGTLAETLRARVPHALYDARFMTQKRKVGLTSFGGLTNERRVETSNAPENELAAHLLALAHEQGQL